MRKLKINRKVAFGLILVGGLAIAAMAFADPPVHTKLFVRQFDASTPPFIGPTVEGSSAKLQRSEDAIWIKINTTQLPAGAYTVWAVIFNNPENCAGGVGNCAPADVPIPAVNASVFWATGGPVGDTGVGHADIFIEEGTPPGQVLRGPGLVDAENAEVHLIVRYHGPVSDDPAIAEAQTTTVGGGCNLFPCYEPQAARFPFFGN